MSARRTVAWPGVALLVSGLVGCGGGGSGSASSSASSSSPTVVGTSTGTTGPSKAAGVTAPATALAVGGTATVPYRPPGSSGGPTFKLQVTVTAIDKGKLSDFSGIKLDASQRAGTPYYVKVRLTNAGAGDASRQANPSVAINGVDTTGATAQSVTFIGDFPHCPDKEAPKPFSHGKSFETCLTFLVPGGITKAAYVGTDSYITSPVTWAKRPG